MKIEQLHIRNFRGLAKLTLEALHPSVNLFVGSNGAGKSSILDAISMLLSWYTARMQNPRYGMGTQIPLSDIGKDTVTSSLIALSTDDMGAWHLYRSRSRLDKERSDLSGMMTHVKAFIAKIEAHPDTPVPVIAHYKVNRSVTEVPLRVRKAEHSGRMSDVWGNAFGSTSFKEFFGWYREQEDIENEHIRYKAGFRSAELEAIREALRIAFPGYSDLRIRRKPMSMVMEKNGKTLGIEQLSDGEKCYIALICDICRRLAIANPGGDILRGSGIVLIDEIDLHLHPGWQLEVVGTLERIFPNIQFFLTTHSPLVSSDIRGNVYIVADGTAAEVNEYTYGKDSGQLLASLFGVYNPRSPKMQRLIDEAYRQLQQGDFNAFGHTYSIIAEQLGEGDTQAVKLRIESNRRKRQNAE